MIYDEKQHYIVKNPCPKIHYYNFCLLYMKKYYCVQ